MKAPDLLDSKRAETRLESDIARAEVAHRLANSAAAEQWGAMADVLDGAALTPSLFVDPQSVLPHRQRVEFAQRAAAADLAVRLSISEPTVRSRAHDATTLRSRLPQVWAMFCDGEIVPSNARLAAELVRSLPDDPALDRAFDDALRDCATSAPARFRARARVLRERMHSEALDERVRTAKAIRAVWIENELDGMATLAMRLPAEDAHRAYAVIDSTARSLSGGEEARTIAQLRADVAVDLLAHGGQTGTGAARSGHVAVAVTVPVMTLLGHTDEPGTLEGYGPIDAETARRLAAEAPSFTRLLTHPVSGGLLDIDRTTYRVPADLKRWLAVVDTTCRFPGCGRLARNCDLDHTIDFQYGGPTRANNLAHLCRNHHRLKHQTRWAVRHDPEQPEVRVVWTSPTGYERAADPPPF